MQRSGERSEVSYVSTSSLTNGLATERKRWRKKAHEYSCPGEGLKEVIFSFMMCMFLLISCDNNQTYIAVKTKACLLLLIQHLPNSDNFKSLVFNLR